MARIQTPQHVQELQAEFKVREQFGLELLETVQPTYSLGDIKVASTGYPRKCMGRIAAAAGGVGTNIECALTCPADVGIVILLNSMWIENDSTAVTVGVNITDGVPMATISSNPTDKAFRDGRITGQQPDGITSIANPLTAAPNGRVIGRVIVPASITTIMPLDIILGGGAYLLIRSGTVDGPLNVVFHWTEFLLEDR